MLMTKKEVQGVLSKAMYWNEVIKRENQGTILQKELMDEVKRLGVSILFILEDYALRAKEKYDSNSE
jgi:hypothetical protein